jgi:hypothetical protein
MIFHVCEEVMCLELCPYPKCVGVCNLDHNHTIVHERSTCGCCELHRAYVPTKHAQDESLDAGGVDTFGSALAAKLFANMKLASEIGAAKTKGQRPLQTKRAPPDAVRGGAVAAGPVNEAATAPFYHGFGVNVEKYGGHFQRFANVVPVRIHQYDRFHIKKP